MPVVSRLQSGFTSGELAPELRARLDMAAQLSGAAKMRNVFVVPQGSALRRYGLEYLDNVPSGSIQLIEFKFSGEDHYVCMLSTNELRVYKYGKLIVTLECAITDLQVAECWWDQSYSTLLIFHETLHPLAFIRQDETTWTASNWPLNNIPVAQHGAATTATLTIKDTTAADFKFGEWTTGEIAINAIFSIDPTAFTAEDVGKVIKAGGGYASITGWSSGTPTEVRCTIKTPFRNDADGTTVYPPGEWKICEHMWSVDYGYPRAGTFYGGRLWMVGSTKHPGSAWGSVVRDEYDFTNWLPEYADNGIELTASSGGVQSTFTGIHGGQHLMLFADTGEYFIPTQRQEPITPTNASLVRNSSLGSLNLPVFTVDGGTIFAKSGGKTLIEAKYNFNLAGYNNTDLNLMSSHILNNPKSMAYRKQTDTDEADLILVVNGDGTLAVLCTLRKHEVTAWTLSLTKGDFVATVVDGSEIYFVIDRVINGVAVRTFERFNKDLLVDCALLNPSIGLTYSAVQLTYDGFDMTYGTNLYPHLIGEEVTIVMDNTVQLPQVVDSEGKITIDSNGKDIQAGLNFPVVDEDSGSIVYIETMPIEVDLAVTGGSSVGKKKRVIEVTAMFYETSHAEIRKNNIPIRQMDIDTLDTPVPKKSENITIKGLLGWDDEVEVSVGQTLPLPFQLLGLAYKVRV